MEQDVGLLVSGILLIGAILFVIGLSLDFFSQLGKSGNTDGFL